jgi:5-deoxy-glucuronate isomerase
VSAAGVPVELRGAGQSSRQVRNFGTPDTLPASRIIACEVITPGGNWSSYPAHKHDETTATESELEEIYYFEIAAGPDGQPGFGFMRTSSSPGHDIDLLEEVYDRDLVLVPYGWHGPCVAAPGFDMYYLNVMAGPGAERAWKISDHPDHAWVRGTWDDQDVDPRLTTKDT